MSLAEFIITMKGWARIVRPDATEVSPSHFEKMKTAVRDMGLPDVEI